MNGVTIIETEELNAIRQQLVTIANFISESNIKEPSLLTISQVAERTGLSNSTIERVREDIGYTSIGGCYRFKAKDVESWIDENYTKIRRAS